MPDGEPFTSFGIQMRPDGKYQIVISHFKDNGVISEAWSEEMPEEELQFAQDSFMRCLWQKASIR